MNYHDAPIVNDKEVYRWLIDKNYDLPRILQNIPRGSLSRESWPKGVSIEAFSKGPLEDFPMTAADRPVVSERVKAEFERAFPGVASFFAFEIKWRKKLVISKRYFVCEWAKPPIDCIDMKRSKVLWDGGGSSPFVYRPVLDCRRLPSDRVVSYVEHIMFDSVAWPPMKDLCESRGFTGVRFEELPVV
jgi:hypothetical protein